MINAILLSVTPAGYIFFFSYCAFNPVSQEDKIADRREYYNDSVNLYNIGIEEFPNVILAGLLGYKQRNLFTVLPEEKEYHGVQI